MSAASDVLIRQALQSAVVPAVIASGFAILGPKCVAKYRKSPIWSLLAVAIGFAVAAHFVMGSFRFPPKSVTQWIAWYPLLASLSFFALSFIEHQKTRFSAIVVTVVAMVYLLFQPLKYHYSNLTYGLIIVSITGAVVLLYLASKGPWESESKQLLGLLMATVTMAGGALVASLDGSVLLGQYYGVMATLLTVLMLARWLGYSIGGSTEALVLSMALVLFAALAVFFADAKLNALIVSTSGWLLMFVTRISKFMQLKAWTRTSLALVLAIGIQALAVTLLLGAETVEDPSGY